MSAQVFETYELLEDILLRLPLHQLLLAQRVNKNFQAVIQDSLKIKQALFLEPTNKECVQYLCSWSRAPLKLKSDARFNERMWTQDGTTEATGVIANPFVPIKTYNLIVKLSNKLLSGCRKLCTFNGVDLVDRCLCQDKTHSTHPTTRTSLSRMLLSDPPMRNVELGKYHFSRFDSNHCGLIGAAVSNSEGLRYGDLEVCLKQAAVGEATRMELEIDGGDMPLQMPRAVDVLTGWECLEMLSLGMRERSGCCPQSSISCTFWE